MTTDTGLTAPTHPAKTSLPPGTDNSPPPSLVPFLGLFSVGLGLAELLAPRAVADRTGVRHTGLLRAYGLRELAAGIGLLTDRWPAKWLWARVAGDALDLATLGAAYLGASGDDRRRAATAAAAVAGVTLLDLVSALHHT